MGRDQKREIVLSNVFTNFPIQKYEQMFVMQHKQNIQ